MDVWVNVMDIPAMETIRAATYWPAKMMKGGAVYKQE